MKSNSFNILGMLETKNEAQVIDWVSFSKNGSRSDEPDAAPNWTSQEDND